jgi:hypothetical protein
MLSYLHSCFLFVKAQRKRVRWAATGRVVCNTRGYPGEYGQAGFKPDFTPHCGERPRQLRLPRDVFPLGNNQLNDGRSRMNVPAREYFVVSPLESR